MDESEKPPNKYWFTELKAKCFKQVFHFHPFGYSLAAKAKKYGHEKITCMEKFGFSMKLKNASSETSSSHCEYGCLVATAKPDKLINA